MRFHLLFFIYLSTITTVMGQVVASKKDSLAFKEKLQELSDTPHTMTAIGKTFLGTPYVEKTLEIGETEALVINLRGLDCTTYVENVLAFTMLQKQEQQAFESFAKNLKTIRYRNGVLDGYSSRLHYFTDWIKDNEKKGLVQDITSDLGGIQLNKPINFMGTHRKLYPFLADDANYDRILETERTLAKENLCYLPQELIKDQEKHIQSGDIIALATSIKGLDVTHTGIALKKPDGRLYLLHASSSGEVTITSEPLVDYLKKIKSNIGIIVARPTLENIN